MHIWEFHYEGLNDYAVLVPIEDGSNLLPIFSATGKEKIWDVRPKVEPFIEKRKKAAKRRADLSYLIAGSIILNEKAYQALSGFLLPFGQLLELDRKGEIEYFYNVTNVISCIDIAQSEKRGAALVKEKFFLDAVPSAAAIFKDLYTASNAIYFNQAGKEKFEELATNAGLVGARFVEAGQGLI